MTDSTFRSLGEDLVLDEQERQVQLTNEQREKLETRLSEAEKKEEILAQPPAQPATADQIQPQQPQPQPTDEEPQEKPGFSYFGQPIGETSEQVKQRLSAPGQGLIDTLTDGLNKLLENTKFQIPKATPYEDQVASSARQISSVVLPLEPYEKVPSPSDNIA